MATNIHYWSNEGVLTTHHTQGGYRVGAPASFKDNTGANSTCYIDH